MSALFAFTFSQTVLAQSITVTGTVVDNNNEQLPGVNVVIKGTSTGNVTDINGRYSITVPDGNAVLSFSFVGYTTVEETVGIRTAINVIMEEASTALDEVVVIGYTTVRKAELTSSVVTLNSDAITDNVTHDLQSMLQGKVAGLLVTGSSGMPGSEGQVTIRGVGTITAGQSPLYVVDGIPGGSYTPDDIETVTVLKDVGATAIYGADGANGVIVITTKQGRRNTAPSVTLRANFSLVKPNWGNYKPMGSHELYDFFESIDMNNMESEYPRGVRDTDFNWRESIYGNGNTQNYYVSVSGGTQAITYMASASHINQEGTFKGSSFKRSSVRLNLNAQLTKRLDMSLRLNMREREQYGSWHFSIAELAHRGWPWDNPFHEDGTPVSPVDEPTLQWFYKPRTNPHLGYYYGNYNKNGGNGMGMDFVLNYNILPWLSLNNTLRMGRSQRWEKEFLDGRDKNQGNSTGRSIVRDEATLPTGSYTNTTLLRASYRFKKHHLGGVLGYERSEDNGEYEFGARTEGMPTGLDVLSTGQQQYHSTLGGYANRSASESAFGQINYSYADKYLASFSFRADGNTKFPPDRRWGYFPAGSVGWLASNEDFLKGNPVLTYLKLRGSYGLTGNSNIRAFQYLATYSLGSSYYGQTAATPTRLANPDLGWESCLMASAGIDFNLFTWLEASVDLYRNLNKDIIFTVPVAPSTGFYTVQRNLGEISNRGVEFQITTININTQDIRWTTSLNISFNRNRVEKLPENDERGNAIIVGVANNPRQRLEEGRELYSWWMPRWEGVNVNDGTPQWWGYLRDEDGNITENEGVTSNWNDVIEDWTGHSAQPKFTGGFQTTLSYKWFSLNANFFFLYGNKVYNSAMVDGDGPGNYNLVSHKNANKKGLNWKRWRQPGDIATHPKPTSGNYNQGASTRRLEDGSFLRLRNLTVGFNFPSSMLNSIGIKSARVYFTGDNLFVITNKFPASDPETSLRVDGLSPAGTIGFDNNVNRTFSLGLEVVF